MVTQERMEKALQYLARTYEEYGRAKGEMQGRKRKLDIILASLKADIREEPGEKQYSDAKKESIALTNDIYKQAVDEWEQSIINFETLNAKRALEETVIEVWRSVNASMRRGNV